MKYTVAFSKIFKKQYKKLQKNEKNMIQNKMQLLIEDPFHPSLRTKKIKKFNDIFELSINMDLRIIWKYENSSIILLLAVGHHDILESI